MVFHAFLFYILSNALHGHAGCCDRGQHFSIALFALAHLLRVSYELWISARALIIGSCHRVLVSPAALPRFWIFMYRVTPVTYFINALVPTGIAGVSVVCAANEIVSFDPPSGQICSSYLKEYMSYAGGSLLNPTATQRCDFCRAADTDSVLAALGIYFGDRWRNFAISLIYSAVNVAGALCLYWLFRVPKGPGRRNV